MKKGFAFLLPFIFVLASCSINIGSNTNKEEDKQNSGDNGNSGQGDSGSGGESGGGSGEVTPTKKAKELYSISSADFTTRAIASKDKVTYEDLFNLGNKISISIEMEDSELLKLQSDYQFYKDNHSAKVETYRHCKSVTITMVNYSNTFTWTYLDVGIRQKGNTSRETVFTDGKIANLNHFKLSFDETFDDPEMYGSDAVDWTGKEAEKKEREDRDFLGLSGIDLKWNKNYDESHIKEIYASKIYEACGIISQYIGLSTFSISQTDSSKTYNMGLYTIYEPATKSMVKRHLKDASILNMTSWKEEKAGTYGLADSNYGDLYKCAWGADLSSGSMSGNIGVGNYNGTVTYRYERKTNTDVSYADLPLKAVGTAVSSGKYSNMDAKIDLSYFAATEACNYIIGNPDDFRNNTNNNMVYIRRTDGKAITIPIDNDRCFGITKDWNPDGNGMMGVTPYQTNGAGSGNSVGSLYTKTILASSTEAYKVYTNYLKALYQSDWMKTSTFEALFNQAKTTYSGTTSSDLDANASGFSLNSDTYNVTFKDYITAKRSILENELDVTKPIAEQVTITYHASVGTAPSALTLDKGSILNIEQLPNYNQIGYIFYGWYYDSSYNTKAEFGDSISENLDLYAKLEKQPDATVSFVSEYGDAVADQTFAYGTTLTSSILPSISYKSGYTFAGWYLDDEFITKAEGTTLFSATTLYAKWVVASYEDGNYGDVYLQGDFSGWTSTDYKMTFNGYGVYTCTFSPNKNSSFTLKFNGGGSDWSTIDWTIDDSGKLLMSKGGNATITGVTSSSVVTITINTLTLEVIIDIK